MHGDWGFGVMKSGPGAENGEISIYQLIFVCISEYLVLDILTLSKKVAAFGICFLWVYNQNEGRKGYATPVYFVTLRLVVTF